MSCQNESNFIITCPHCNLIILVEKINCGIFRHGINKKTFQQIDPHLSKDKCEMLINNNEILGCGKPFRVNKNNNTNEFVVTICDYI
jgi:hypothetical protein